MSQTPSQTSYAPNWPQERVVVTGGAGFLGGFVVDALKARGATNIVVPRKK